MFKAREGTFCAVRVILWGFSLKDALRINYCSMSFLITQRNDLYTTRNRYLKPEINNFKSQFIKRVKVALWQSNWELTGRKEPREVHLLLQCAVMVAWEGGKCVEWVTGRCVKGHLTPSIPVSLLWGIIILGEDSSLPVNHWHWCQMRYVICIINTSTPSTQLFA